MTDWGDFNVRMLRAVTGYALSLNSRSGKRRAAPGEEGGVLEPVTSDRIVAMFEGHGYQAQGRYGPPLIRSAGELVVLRRAG